MHAPISVDRSANGIGTLIGEHFSLPSNKISLDFQGEGYRAIAVKSRPVQLQTKSIQDFIPEVGAPAIGFRVLRFSLAHYLKVFSRWQVTCFIPRILTADTGRQE